MNDLLLERTISFTFMRRETLDTFNKRNNNLKFQIHLVSVGNQILFK